MADSLVFFVNGCKVTEPNPDPQTTLLTYLRTELQLTGTKLVCGEGGCGACTVMISKYDATNNTILHYSVNACLTPVCSVHGLAVTTTEGIGSLKTRLHPVQEAIAKSHGSQCGFCTPGMVMSMYTLLRNNPQPTMIQIEKYLEGNLCRCTGYRPILEGYRSFSKESCSMGDRCCKNKNPEKQQNGNNQVNGYSPLYDPTQEPIFPPDLKTNHKQYNKTSLLFEKNGIKWYRPVTLSELLDLKHQYPQAKIVVGNTEIGIETRFKNMKYPVLINASHVDQLTDIKITERGLQVGSSVSLSRLEEVLQQTVDNSPEEKTRIFRAVIEMLRWFAGKQIKNVAAIGGNIMTASPISDLNPLLQASSASLQVASKENGERSVQMDVNFFKSYRKTELKAQEVLLSIVIPFTDKNEYFESYKQALRKEDDISIVNAGMRVVFQDNSDLIKELYLSYGGMAPTTVMAKNTMQKLVGRRWSEEVVGEGCQYLEGDLPLPPDAPGGMIEYRRTLTTSFFFKFYLTVAQQLHSKGLANRSSIPDSYVSAIEEDEETASRGSQVFESVGAAQREENPIGRPLVHSSAYQQATGEAVYIDDMLPLKGELYVAPVYSTRAHATLLNVDSSPVLQIPGVKGFIDYRDVPGKNRIDISNEEFLATEEVTCEGCLIGGVVATSSEVARQVSKLVNIEYKDLKPILTIEEAIENNSYLGDPLVQTCGDVDAGFKFSEEILEGRVYMGTQEHFYLETQVSIAVPKERDEMDIVSAAQSIDFVQKCVADVLGVSFNKVRCSTRRLGGGFGGKNTQNIQFALLASVAAKKYNVPVKCSLERDDDMSTTGRRHPVDVRYKVGFSNDGRISSLDICVYVNSGNSDDLTVATLDNLIRRIDNAYKIPNLRVTGHMCKTNIKSNTSIRACGTIQSMFIIESIMQHVIDHLNIEDTKVREANFLREGDRILVNQIIKDCNIQTCWEECLTKSDYYTRKAQVEQFNRDNKWKKRGISILPLRYGISIGTLMFNQGAALVNVYTDGSVILTHGGIEMGQGIHTKMLQVASTTLGIPINMVHTPENRTDAVPNATITAASIGSDIFGMAVKFACDKIVKRLEPYMNEKGSSWKDWVGRAYADRVNLSATGFYKVPNLGPDPETDSNNSFYYDTYGAGCTEVEIDCLTGDHKTLRTDIVMDVGKSLNPAIDIGQIEGAFMMGYGLFMLERIQVSPKGTLLTKGPGNYKMPTVGNIPQTFNVSLLKGSTNSRAVYSSKAIGEPPFLLSMSIFLATKSAIMAARSENGKPGYFPFDSPATCDKIRMACEDELSKQFPAAEKGSYEPWFVQL